MSSGQIVGGVIGAVAGFFVGGPAGAFKGAMYGMSIGGMLDPPKGPDIQGPRLSDLTTQTSTYGAAIPRLYGANAVAGNVFWIENDKLKEVSSTENQGGKGGGGSDVTTFSYFGTFAVGLGEGPTAGVRRIWIGSKLFYDAGSNDPGTIQASAEASGKFRLYLGTDTQTPDPRMQAALGVANTPAFRGLVYIVFYDLPLADYQNSLIGAQVKVELLSAMTATVIEKTVVSDTTCQSDGAPTVLATVAPEWTAIPGAAYIWDTASELNGTANKVLTYTKTFTPDGSTIALQVACDNQAKIYLNDALVGDTGILYAVLAIDLTGLVMGGENTLTFVCTNFYLAERLPTASNAAGLAFKLSMRSTIVAPVLVTLGSIVSAEVLGSNLLTAGDIDVTALTRPVRGYRVNSVAAIRGALEPLQGAWPFDVVQAGYKINFKLRGGASVATIPVAKLDARGAADAPGVQITNVREMDLVLPKKVSIKYFDEAREYDTGEQSAERLSTDAINIQQLEMAVVLTAGEAAQKAEILLYMYWLERFDVAFKLSPEYQHLEPGDVVTIVAPDGVLELRLTAINYTSDSRLECQAKYNSAATYTSTAVGSTGGSTGRTLQPKGPTVYKLLDVPLLNDAFNRAGFPLAMTGPSAGWPGGVLYRSDDAGQTWVVVVGMAVPGSTIGAAINAIGAHSGLMIDKAGALGVTLVQGALASVTELQMLNGVNHFAYGADGRWEIIAAQNCVLQVDGSYILTDFLRGRFGTEWATGLHAANDSVVLVNAASLQFVGVNINTIGSARLYRGISAGNTINSAPDVPFAYRGVNLECLSPVYLNGGRHPTSGDWSLNWIRRTRIGGAWRDLVDATLGEASEAYEVDVFADSTYATVRRTLTASTPAVTYNSAQQVADFGTNQTTLYIKVYQLSGVVGRGYPLTNSLAR